MASHFAPNVKECQYGRQTRVDVRGRGDGDFQQYKCERQRDSHRLMHFEQGCCIGVIRRDLQQYRRSEQIS
jgi:hypothetical protein